MMTTLVYPYPVDARETFLPFAKRYVESYLKHRPGIPHEMALVFCGGEPTQEEEELFAALPHATYLFYHGGGIDIGAAQFAALGLDTDFMVASTSRAYFHREGWLKRIWEARQAEGPGLYGAVGSYEPWNGMPHKNPHIRTVLYGVDTKILRTYPHVVTNRDTAHAFEAGKWNFTTWVRSGPWSAKMVDWTSEYGIDEWRRPPNIFRRGDQSNILCHDKHSDAWAAADPEAKIRMTRVADGERNPA